ncbi:DUF4389 domain-containing protein [Allosalinactinospora lopnorensis]|uniref:DUF4389 domain-containing protein n=1 Tax=Allosalinactinospora lopnorensis TaxID=1352348 RepID=UPI000623D713|nr:DUF4389 domain-containing protein [Allosalinactinospora lopnorensis]
MADAGIYPVKVDGDLDPGLRRWVWLVKWILAIPHYVVLFFLWIAFAVLTIVVFFAILITGRYPEPIFRFNVGVLRWSWRVRYYAYSALGTDRYPPFTIAERGNYPARFEVDYPERLSRGLVLVKWWLLALPHYVVVSIFVGSGPYLLYLGYPWRDGGEPDGAGTYYNWSLIYVLVLFAAVVLLFAGFYPRGIFDFVLGMNRWRLRVSAYAALMTDHYPPFRLDPGGADPARRGPPREGPPDAGTMPYVPT